MRMWLRASRDTGVQVGGEGPKVHAEVVQFDPRNDVAVLRVGDLPGRALALASDPRAGTPAAILGYPLDGPFDAEPGRIGQTQPIRTQDAYGEGEIVRSITTLRGRVRPGNSGGPMVDAAGQVVATVFAAITGGTDAGANEGGFAVPNAVVRSELAVARTSSGPVGTGHCAG